MDTIFKKCKINELSSKYFDEISLMFLSTFTGSPRYEKWNIEEVKNFLRKHDSTGGMAFLAFDNNCLVGYQISTSLTNLDIFQDIQLPLMSPKPYYLSVLNVDVNHRNKGIGKQLIEMTVQWAMANSYDSVVSRTRSDSHDVNKLLHSLGFKIIKEYESSVGGKCAKRLIHQFILND